jgi:hypothetical protein
MLQRQGCRVLPVILIVSCLFGFLFLARLAGARRTTLLKQLPALLLAAAAIYALSRGAYWAGLGLGIGAAIAWMVTPSMRPAPRSRRARPRSASSPTREDAADAEARAILGVRMGATEAEIRSAYRARITQAHPDRGGTHAEAARLTAARDRLLRRSR